MSSPKFITIIGAVAVFTVLAVVLVVGSREPGIDGHPKPSDEVAEGGRGTAVSGGSEAPLPPKKKQGKGELSEPQQRHLFRKIAGFELPAHARDFDGRYYHDYMHREEHYYLSRTGYCTLPLEEAESILALLKERWEALGTKDDEAPNYFTYNHEMPYELGPRWGDRFPVGFRFLSLSRIDGQRKRRGVYLNPTTGRMSFYESAHVE